MISWCSKNQMFQVLTKKFNFQPFESWKQSHHKDVRAKHLVHFSRDSWTTVFKFVRDLLVFVSINCACGLILIACAKFLNDSSMHIGPFIVHVRPPKVFFSDAGDLLEPGMGGPSWACSNNFKQSKINVILMFRH